MAAAPVATKVEEFSEPHSEPTAWSDVDRVLRESEMFWLSTVRSDGRPHVAPLPAMWLRGRLHFCTGAHEQKARNIDTNPKAVLTTGTNTIRTGMDVVVEGTVAGLTDHDALGELAAMWKSKLDWSFDVVDGHFHHPEDEDRPVPVFALTPSKVLAFARDPACQTRFTFPAGTA